MKQKQRRRKNVLFMALFLKFVGCIRFFEHANTEFRLKTAVGQFSWNVHRNNGKGTKRTIMICLIAVVQI